MLVDFALQVFRKRFACGRLARRGLARRRFRSLCLRGFQIFQDQFELIDLRVILLAGPAELQALQVSNLQLEFLDPGAQVQRFGVARFELFAQEVAFIVGLLGQCALLIEQPSQDNGIVRIMFGCDAHASQCKPTPPTIPTLRRPSLVAMYGAACASRSLLTTSTVEQS